MSLVAGWFPVAVAVAAVLALLALVPWEQRARWRVLGEAVAVAALLTVLTVVVLHATGALPWAVPWTFDAWFGAVLLAPVLAVVTWRRVRWRRLLGPVAFVVCLAAAATVVNQQYGYLPTTRALVDPPADSSSLGSVERERAHHEHLHHGAVLEVSIPATVSHFAAREAYVWLPPAYLQDPRLSLPVVELLEGSPSDPVDWICGGAAAATADAYARSHAGVAPLLVMPDENGSLTGDTECVDGPAGNAETYLTVDVPAYLRHTFQAESGPDSLAVAGLSEGATCSVMLTLRHPGEYRAFGSYAGLTSPTVGQQVAPAATIRALFHGSVAQYQAHDPVHLLRHGHDPGTAGWFEVGSADRPCLRAQTTLVPLARAAGVTTQAVVVPGGGHDFTLWAQAFAASLPFLASHLATPAAV